MRGNPSIHHRSLAVIHLLKPPQAISQWKLVLEPSFKVAVPLTPAEAIAIASDLLNAALPQLAELRASVEARAEPDMEEERVAS